jgi:hypothetical protein
MLLRDLGTTLRIPIAAWSYYCHELAFARFEGLCSLLAKYAALSRKGDSLTGLLSYAWQGWSLINR